MEAIKLFFILTVLDLAVGFHLGTAVEYFTRKNLKFLTGFLCNQTETEKFAKSLSYAGIRSNFPLLKGIETSDDLWHGLYYPSEHRTGVVVDMNCENSETLLKIASENRYFDINRHWLIYTTEYFTKDDFRKIAVENEPQMFDPREYLEEGNAAMTYGPRMQELNLEANADILDDPLVLAMTAIRNKPENNSGFLVNYVNLKALVDSEVVLAVAENERLFSLYLIHRITIFTKMVIEDIGKMWEEDGEGFLDLLVPPDISSVNGRKDFNGTLIRAAVALLHRGYYSKSDKLTPKQFDYWAMKNTQISILAQKQYNFRLLVKCFDDYGWMLKDGTYTGMLRHFYYNKADMSAGGMLLINSRRGAIDYVNNNCLVRMALFFKQPALSQVTNIFVLPFSRGVWLSIAAIMVIAGFMLYFQIRVTRKLESSRIKFPEIFTFLTGAACQQGFDITTNILSARMTMLMFLASVLFLFTSYNANIVSLLQASSDSINNIRTFIDSTLGMAVENLGYEIKLIEDDNDPLIRELYQKKLADKQVGGTAYIDSDEGMERVRKELFAFHLEVETGARIIGETYSESEKCRLNRITLFPNRFNGHVVPKKSPYRETLAQAFRWYTEVGFTQRGITRFSYSEPKCSTSGSGFNSIGLSDVHYVVLFFVFGIGLSFFCLIGEKLLFFREQHRKSRKIHATNGKFVKSHFLGKHDFPSYVN